jgi:hypothetical protein
VFRDSTVRDYYLNKLRREGFRTVPSDYFRMGFFAYNFPEVKVREEWGILGPEDREYTVSESKQFWQEWVTILTEQRKE